jgi:hypothetical protein
MAASPEDEAVPDSAGVALLVVVGTLTSFRRGGDFDALLA